MIQGVFFRFRTFFTLWILITPKKTMTCPLLCVCFSVRNIHYVTLICGCGRATRSWETLPLRYYSPFQAQIRTRRYLWNWSLGTTSDLLTYCRSVSNRSAAILLLEFKVRWNPIRSMYSRAQTLRALLDYRFEFVYACKCSATNNECKKKNISSKCS